MVAGVVASDWRSCQCERTWCACLSFALEQVKQGIGSLVRIRGVGHGRGESLVHLQLHHQSLYINIQEPSSIFSAHLFFADASHAQMPFSFLDTWHSKIDLNLDMKF